MNTSSESIKDAVLRLFPSSSSYTSQEEDAILEFYNLFDADELLQDWKKYLPKPMVIFGLRICQLEAHKMFELARALFEVVMITFPDLISRLEPKNLPDIGTCNMVQILKRNQQEVGPSVVVLRLSKWDPSKFNLDDVLLFNFLLYIFAARSSPEMQRAGVLVIVDMRGLKLAHVSHLTTFDLVKKSAVISMKVPTKLSRKVVKGCILVHSNALVVRTFHAFRWLIPKKMRKKIELTQSDMSYVTNIVDPQKLPEEFGGVIDDKEAYFEGLADDLMSDAKLVPALEHIKIEILRNSGYYKIN
ncbi:Alpha-tocopherol transfer protein [Folsomia candida]|uniref:Alpha-tocopherol transfer protein n=1 Tax=Folsomia candida TaxID=158441 RepID=A0A226D3B8_FOLCA|nr:Alpha-tocopherol transfer protein [Folsomia candida]